MSEEDKLPMKMSYMTPGNIEELLSKMNFAGIGKMLAEMMEETDTPTL